MTDADEKHSDATHGIDRQQAIVLVQRAVHAATGPWASRKLCGQYKPLKRTFDSNPADVGLFHPLAGALALRLGQRGFLLGYTSYAAMSVWLAYTSWIPNVIAVVVYSALERSTFRRPSPQGGLTSA
jgi:hypothetical protein